MSRAELQANARIDGLRASDVREALWEERRLVKVRSFRQTLHMMTPDDLVAFVAAARSLERWHAPAWWRYFHLTEADVDGDDRRGRGRTVRATAGPRGPRRGRHDLTGWGTFLAPAAQRGRLVFGPSERKVAFVNPERWLRPKFEPSPDEAAADAALSRLIVRYLAVFPRATKAMVYCTFTKTAVNSGSGDDAVAVTAQGDAQGLPTGQTTGAAVIKVIPAPRLQISLLASPYRLGGSGNGTLGVIDYTTGGLTLDRNTSSALTEVQNPTGWFYFKVVNQGGAAANFSANVTQQGAGVLPASCPIPASLAASGQPGSVFSCVFPRTFNATQNYAFVGSASATNAIIVGGTQKSLTLTTATCSGGQLPVPNLVDTLNPSADGSRKTVAQAKSTWLAAGFTGALTTNPAGASNSLSAITQNQLAYSCKAANSTIIVGAQ